MPRISDLELMELLEQILMETPSGYSDGARQSPARRRKSTLEPPGPQLREGPVSLAILLDGNTNLLEAVAKRFAANGRHDDAGVVSAIREFLQNRGDDLAVDNKEPRRLLDFVYTVV